MSDVLPSPPALIDQRVDTIVIDPSISFNEWRRYMEGLLVATGTMQWFVGDGWIFAQETFAIEYQAAMDEISHAHGTVVEYARVARAFPPRHDGEAVHRISELSFWHHKVAASVKDPQERMAWLEDALRQGWSHRTLQEELQRAQLVEKVPALSVRLVEEHYDLAIAAARRREMDPRDWILEAIREKHEREAAAELEAAA